MNDLFSRNYFYIDEDLQAKAAHTSVVFLGTGLASTIAEVMVRTGFSKITLCDGDVVEKSNLNRQNFDFDDIEKSKALSLKKRLMSINPNVSCNCIDERLDSIDQIDEPDIIINTIDCGDLYFEIIETYRKKNKLVLCPFNPGFGGLVVCFTAESASSFDFFETTEPIDDMQVASCLLQKANGLITNQKNEAFLQSIREKGYFPQLGIGSALTAAITTTATLNYLKGEPIVLAPDFYYTPSDFTGVKRISCDDYVDDF